MNRRNFLRGSALAGVPAVMGLGLSAAEAKGTRIRKVEVLPTRVPFQRSFRIATGSVGAAGQTMAGRHVFVRLETDDGHVGWGETNTLPYWSYETLESVTTTLRQYLAPMVMNRSPFEVNALEKAWDAALAPAISNGHPFAKSAMMGAMMDLMGQITGQPLHRLFGGRVRDTIDLTYALSIAEPERMAQDAAGFSFCKCFKVKVAGDADLDTRRMMAVAKARPDADLWVDANQSYKPIALDSFLNQIAGMPKVRCLEQPVKSQDWFGVKRARELRRFPVAVDEGCFSSYDVARLARMEAADLIVLKVAKSGGLLGCQRSAHVADANGWGILGSGLTEAGVAFTAAIHLYSTLDLLLPPELNGPEFLESMLVDGLEIKGVTVTVPDGPGIGVKVREAEIRKLALV
jgi:muconate cycloisomerase